MAHKSIFMAFSLEKIDFPRALQADEMVDRGQGFLKRHYRYPNAYHAKADPARHHGCVPQVTKEPINRFFWHFHSKKSIFQELYRLMGGWNGPESFSETTTGPHTPLIKKGAWALVLAPRYRCRECRRMAEKLAF